MRIRFLVPDALRSRLDGAAHGHATAAGDPDLAEEIVGGLEGRLASEGGLLDC